MTTVQIVRRALSGLFAVALMVLLPASPASAHAVLLKTNPLPGSIVQTAPKQVELTFSESITPVKNKILITGPDGKRADNGDLTVDGPIMRIGMKDNPPTGTYLVSFRIVSADSHPVPGGYTFSVGAPSATPTEVPAETVDKTVSWAIGIAKYVGYLGLVLFVGAAFVLALLWPARLERRDPKRLLWLGFGLVALSTVAGLYLQVPYTNGGGLFDMDSAAFGEMMSSTYGMALLVRLGVLAIAAIMLQPLINGRGGIVDRVLVSIVAVVGALTWPLAGHAAASPVPAISVVVDALHLGAAATWLGGLTMLAIFLLRRADRRELLAILPVWSRWAGIAVATVILAGTVSALIEVTTFTALFQTSYGRFVLIKVALVAVVLVAAMFARNAVQIRRVDIGKFVKVEVAVAVVILAVTSALTYTTPARTAEAVANAPAPSEVFGSTLDSSLFRLNVEIDPAKQGGNLMHLYAYTPEGNPLTVVEWKATYALPAAGVEPVEIPTLKITDNHVTGVFSLPSPGEWVFRFTLRTTEIDQDSVTLTLPVQ